MAGTSLEFWIDGAKRPRTWAERLDRKWRKLTGPKFAGKAAVTGPNGRIALDLPADPGIRYVLDEVLARDCYPVVPGVGGIATIVDIGANVGIAAVRLRLAYPDARILCFEPNPAALPFLRINAERARAETLDYGLGETDATLPLYQGSHSTVTASLTAHHMTEAKPLGDVVIRAAGSALAALGVTAIDLLKIDTEGAEMPILRSLAPFLAGVRIAHLEFHSESDRRAIDAMFAPTHLLWSGTVERGHTGQIAYVRRDLAPDQPRIGA